MTANAKKLTQRANLQGSAAAAISTRPTATLRVFVNALGRLGYDPHVLMEDPDGRVPCTSIPAVICEAMRRGPVQHLGLKVAGETPIGAFKLLDYLIVTCETVGKACGSSLDICALVRHHFRSKSEMKKSRSGLFTWA
jgi:hypothetical protein